MRVLQSARSLFGVVLFGLAIAGCGDSNAPDAPFDPAGTSGDIDGMSAAFEADVMASYVGSSAQISAYVGGSAAAALASVPTASAVRDRAGAMRYSASLAKKYVSAGGLRPSFSSSAVPAQYLGVTFTYDVNTHSYVESELPGAPSNGARFLLYAVNPITREIVEPLNQIGYADIISTETSVQVRLVSGGVTYLDYTVAVGGTPSSITISVSGYATNGVERADFDMDNHVSGSDTEFTIGIDYLVSVPTRGGFRIEMDGTMVVTQIAPGEFHIQLSLDLEARGEHGTVRVTGSETDNTGNYQVFVNGDLFATITVTAGGTTVVTGASGAPLTDQERLVVLGVFNVFLEGSVFFSELLEPVGAGMN
jgi:hypothetical protein